MGWLARGRHDLCSCATSSLTSGPVDHATHASLCVGMTIDNGVLVSQAMVPLLPFIGDYENR